MEGFKKYEGKTVFIQLKNGRSYSGKVLEIETKGEISILTICDKFGKNVSFYVGEISVIEEEEQK